MASAGQERNGVDAGRLPTSPRAAEAPVAKALENPVSGHPKVEPYPSAALRQFWQENPHLLRAGVSNRRAIRQQLVDAGKKFEGAPPLATTLASFGVTPSEVKEGTQMHSRGSQTDHSSIAGIPLRVGVPGSSEAGVRRVRPPPPPMDTSTSDVVGDTGGCPSDGRMPGDVMMKLRAHAKLYKQTGEYVPGWEITFRAPGYRTQTQSAEILYQMFGLHDYFAPGAWSGGAHARWTLEWHWAHFKHDGLEFYRSHLEGKEAILQHKFGMIAEAYEQSGSVPSAMAAFLLTDW